MTRNPERWITLVAGAVLLLAAVVFAALRSEGYSLAMSRNGETLSAVGLSQQERFDWFAAASATWDARCAGCHLELDYIPALFAAEGGREFLIQLMLFGADGEARIYGQVQNLRHRPFADQFDDAEMAGLLNLMLVAWGNEAELPADTELYGPADVAAAREPVIAQEDVLQGRPDYPQ